MHLWLIKNMKIIFVCQTQQLNITAIHLQLSFDKNLRPTDFVYKYLRCRYL
jgi:hypothetical protein